MLFQIGMGTQKAWKMKRLFPADGWMVPGTARCGAHGGFLGNTLCLMNISPVPQGFRGRSSLRPCGPGRKLSSPAGVFWA